MKIIAGAIVIAAMALSGSATAQERRSDRPSIVVTGNGEASASPDRFLINAGVEGRGQTQAEALGALSVAQSRIMTTLPRLEGLTHAILTTGNVAINPIIDRSCEQVAGRSEACPVLGYRAGTQIRLEGAPAGRAGDALSLASELGATQASLEKYGLADESALLAEANLAAFADAREQAERMSRASGTRLVRILRIQDPSSAMRDSGFVGGNGDGGPVVVTGSRVRQTISIGVAPEPVIARARVYVEFEIE